MGDVHSPDLKRDVRDRLAELLHNEFGGHGSTWAHLSEAGKQRWRKKAARLIVSAALPSVGLIIRDTGEDAPPPPPGQDTRGRR